MHGMHKPKDYKNIYTSSLDKTVCFPTADHATTPNPGPNPGPNAFKAMHVHRWRTEAHQWNQVYQELINSEK